jgi:hypothetical protein
MRPLRALETNRWRCSTVKTSRASARGRAFLTSVLKLTGLPPAPKQQPFGYQYCRHLGCVELRHKPLRQRPEAIGARQSQGFRPARVIQEHWLTIPNRQQFGDLQERCKADCVTDPIGGILPMTLRTLKRVLRLGFGKTLFFSTFQDDAEQLFNHPGAMFPVSPQQICRARGRRRRLGFRKFRHGQAYADRRTRAFGAGPAVSIVVGSSTT